MFNTAVDWSYYTEPQAGCRGRRIFWPRGKMVGGSGAINAMIYIRGLPSDYDGWEKAGCAGWAWRDVLPKFIAFENNARFIDDPLHGTSGPLYVADVPHVDPNELKWLEAAQAAGLPHNPDFNGATQEGAGFFQFVIRDGERFGTGKAYLRPALTRANLTLKTSVRVTRIIIERSRAIGVEYLENGQPKSAFATGEVVLASGAIGSAQQLLLSGVGPADELKAAGVEVVHELAGVGRDLQDHINIPITFYTKEKIGVGAWTQESLAASLAKWETSRSGPRTSPWVAAGAHVRSRPDVEPDLQLYGAISPHRDYVRFLSSRPGITLHATLQRPNSRGRITLRSADPIEHPAIDPCYFASDASGSDIATMIEGVRINRRIAAQSPLKEMIEGEVTPSAEAASDAEIADYIRGHCTTLYHAASTCRMGTDDLAVVDPQRLQVRGIDGLHIADASVIPIMVSGNIQTPTILIAESAAAAILG
jgi:choline dehydrogenase